MVNLHDVARQVQVKQDPTYAQPTNRPELRVFCLGDRLHVHPHQSRSKLYTLTCKVLRRDKGSSGMARELPVRKFEVLRTASGRDVPTGSAGRLRWCTTSLAVATAQMRSLYQLQVKRHLVVL